MISLLGRPYCQKVLPLVYDESLSYYEQVCKLRQKINEIIEQLTDWSDVIAELQEAIKDIDGMKHNISVLQGDIESINSQINSINDTIDSLDGYVKNMERQFDKRLSDDEDSLANLVQVISKLRTDVFVAIEALREELTELFNSFTADYEEELELLKLKLNQLKVNLQSQIDELRKRVDEIDTTVINPWHTNYGKVSQQRNVNLMYKDLADCVPTASEYCQESLTAQEYANIGLTALEYVQRGREKLHMLWVFSPAYGWRQELNNVLTSILNFVYDTYTAQGYTELDLTADDYTALNLTADGYLVANYSGGGGDTRGFVKYNSIGTGLTRREYEHLEVSQT